MTIYHKIEDFLAELFPGIESTGDLDVLKDQLKRYYTYGAYEPKVSIEGDLVRIDIDTPTILNQDADYRKVVSLCDSGKFSDAKKLLKPLIDKNPSNSEYHRIYGQILSEEGNQEEAINYLIDALRWNPKNGYALLMMGNIFARYKEDLHTARKYYDQALKVNPTDHITINNIGGNLIRLGKLEEGVEYLEKAYAIEPTYPNTSLGIALAYEQLGYPLMAFDFAINCMKYAGKDERLYQVAYSTAGKLAQQYMASGSGKRVFDEYKGFLEGKYKKEIRVEEDSSLPTAAKLEFAEKYNRDYHLIKYKPQYDAVEHLMMHELVHLEFASEARAESANMLFISGAEKRVQFLRDHSNDRRKLQKEGIPEASVANYFEALYDGINLQVYNTPIDLFIEDYLFENYKELRPYQFISLLQLINEGKVAVTDKRAVSLAPRNILTASKVLNLLNAILFKDLYAVDLVKQHNPLPYEQKEAERMWAEFVEYRKDRKPGEEYEIIQHWGEDLKLEKYFELVDEEDFYNRPQTIDEVLNSAIEDPFGTDIDKNFKDKQTKKFLNNQEAIGTNMAVVMFMVDALQFFKGMSKDKIKQLAFEIAMIGTGGINPAPGNTYHVRSIPGKEFSGYHLLAYYYVSWKLAVPEMLADLRLPFDEEYKLAEMMHGGGTK
ncbi:tetratricopeptide repeat protein [Flavisolibacter tropicus]|nr:tetratricopeptide repeat protein [Flavisolibacter tropicus]